jgi:uncharacterized protein (TIGR02271 family)
MRWDRNSIREGTLVTSTTGERIGKVIRCDAETFIVEKGALFPKDYQLRYDQITGSNDDGSLLYSMSEAPARERAAYSSERAEEESSPGSSAEPESRASTMAEPESRASSSAEPLGEARVMAEPESRASSVAPEPRAAAAESDHEVRIPLLDEELDIEKFAYESGRVRIHKGVKVEERHFTVPVRREEIVVEHVSTRDWLPSVSLNATLSSNAFQDQDLDIPIYEEDIRVGKHPVVREEFVVRTVAHDIDLEGSASLRSEDAEIEDTRPRPGMSASGGNGSSATGYGAPGRR